jgi:hypothetical protein
MCNPQLIATDPAGRLYVVDYANSRVLVYDTADDTDFDTIANTSDNCPTIAGASQTNTDAAAILTPSLPADDTIAMSDPHGDLCDPDDDNDYLFDTQEAAGAPCASATGATNPLVADTDGDRWIDGAECAIGSNPNSSASRPTTLGQGTPGVCPETPDHDDDGDRLKNSFELVLGTDRCDSDTDNDGVSDGTEYGGYGTSPFVLDSDGDGFRDCREIGDVNGN